MTEGPTCDDIMSVTGLTMSRPGLGEEPNFLLSVPDFKVRRGARIGLIGESGSGKTTFLEGLGLLAWPDAVTQYDFAPAAGQGVMNLREALQGRQSSLLTELRARTIGFVLQDGGLLPYLTVRENAELSQRLSRQASAPERIKILAQTMGIVDYLDRYQSTLSGGQRQRAAVLRTLAANVSLLLADEPTASLDPRNSDAVLEAMVHSGTEAGATMIVASHNADLLAAYEFELMRIEVSEGETYRHATLVAA